MLVAYALAQIIFGGIFKHAANMAVVCKRRANAVNFVRLVQVSGVNVETRFSSNRCRSRDDPSRVEGEVCLVDKEQLDRQFVAPSLLDQDRDRARLRHRLCEVSGE